MFDPTVAAGISVIALTLVVFLVWAIGKSSTNAEERRRHVRIAALAGVGWLLFLAVLALSGALARFDSKPPPLAVVACVSVFGAAALGFSRIGKQLSELPLALLVGWQAFRLPLELVMHHAAEIGLMPAVMSFSGRNFDIVSGIGALILALAMSRTQVPLWIVGVWQIVASALLLNIVVVAIAATPLFRAFGDSQLNTWVAYFPYVWLLGVMVASAVLGHVVIARKLLSARTVAGLAPQATAKPS